VIVQIPGVDRHRFRPSNDRQIRHHRDQRKDDRPDRVDVHGGIERHAAEHPRRRIAEAIGGKRVRRFVHRQGKQQNEK
jgi:hypothetical protein